MENISEKTTHAHRMHPAWFFLIGLQAGILIFWKIVAIIQFFLVQHLTIE
jgi:hypothetical protein